MKKSRKLIFKGGSSKWPKGSVPGETTFNGMSKPEHYIYPITQSEINADIIQDALAKQKQNRNRRERSNAFFSSKRQIYNNNRKWQSKSGKNLGVWKSIVGDYHKKLELCEEKLRHSELKINQHETEIREMKDIVIRLEDEIGVFEIENIQLREIINNKNNC